jgi:WD40 repeat protein
VNEPVDEAADRIRAFNFSQQLSRLTHGFHGREWLLERIRHWIARSDASLLLVEGEPGAGKSALIAQLAKTHTDVAAVHFCLADDVRTIRPGGLLRSLASMLAETVPGYGNALANTINPARLSIHIDIQAQAVENVVGVVIEHLHAPLAAEELDILLQAPLSVLPRPARPVVILLDALDEALTLSEDENIVSLLAAAQGLPPWVRIVCTSRPDERVRVRLHRAEVLDLRLWAKEVADDVARYVEARVEGLSIGEPSRRAIVTTCTAEPNFLFARLILDDVARSPARYFDPTSGELLESIPSDLEGLYIVFLNRLPRSRWEHTYQRLFSALCVAREPWTERQLSQFSGLSLGDLRRDASAIAQFLKVQDDSRGVRTFAFFHPSFRLFLTDPDASRGYYCEERDGHSLVVGPRADRVERFAAFDTLDPYLQVHGLRHLCAAGDVAAASKILASFDWVLGKVRALGIQAVIADFEIGARGLEACAPVALLLRRTSHVLRRDPGQLAGQLILGLQPASTPVADSLVRGAEAHSGEAWLRPIGHVRTRTGASQTFHVAGGIDGVGISGDGCQAFFGHGSMATLLDLESGQQIRSYSDHKSKAEAVAMSSDGMWFATAPLFDPISIWNIDGLVQRLDWRKDQRSRIFLTDGLLLAIGKRGEPPETEKTLLCWDIAEHRWLPTPVTNPDNDIFVARGGRVVVRDDEQVKAWRAREPSDLIVFPYEYCFRDANADLSPDGRLLAHQTEDCKIAIRDLDTGYVTHSIQPPREPGDKEQRQLAFADGGRLLALLTFDFNDNLRPARITVWNLETEAQLMDLAAHNGMAFELTGSDCSPRFLTGSSDGELKLWEPRSALTIAQQTSGHAQRVTCLSFSGRWIVSGGEDGAVVMWDPTTGKPIECFAAHEDGVSALDLDPEIGVLVTVGQQGEVRIWDLATRSFRQSFRPPGGGAVAAEVLNAEELICFCDNGGIGRWSMRTSTYHADLKSGGGPRGITGVAAARERQLFAFLASTGGRFQTSYDVTFWQIVVWDASARHVSETTVWKGYEESLAPAISRDGEHVYVGRDAGVERLLVSNTKVSRTYPHDANVRLVAIDEARRRLATTTTLGDLRIWDENAGVVIAQFGLDVSPTALSISEDGRFVAVGTDTAEVLFFELAE